MKQRTFLSKGLFEKDFMQSKVTTRNMTGMEKFMGYLLGPGLIVLFTCMITYLREIFYVDVWKMDVVFGARTYMGMNTVSTISSTIGGLLVGYLTTHTVSRAGRIRPYVLIGSLLATISGVAMFWNPFPVENKTAFMAWVYFTNILYYGVAFFLYNVRVHMLALSTRNVKDRNQVTTMRTAAEAIIPGAFVSLVVMGVPYYIFLQIPQPDGSVVIGDESVWRMFIAIPALVGVPGALIEYFWTKERITEDGQP